MQENLSTGGVFTTVLSMYAEQESGSKSQESGKDPLNILGIKIDISFMIEFLSGHFFPPNVFVYFEQDVSLVTNFG